ncbi:hypothetical protein [Bradyrhizobium sp. CCBAU 45384]|uniref:hypothetical protein n=1 Tax=Bradyrhizobium sp. CCBAU 45384 TaxID=858428 RepID=UPI002304FE53|nr:hypothetical protein [Bradyrhizobium sp. CCBAU 45384]MDA9411512.1 hypothetical protein [Bradyrhizobium sp. CCBAU 45384]
MACRRSSPTTNRRRSARRATPRSLASDPDYFDKAAMTEQDGAAIIAFLKTLTDGYKVENERSLR